MEEQNEQSLRERIERLERGVEELRRNIDQLSRMLAKKSVQASPALDLPVSAPAKAAGPVFPGAPQSIERAPAVQKVDKVSKAMKKGEYWFSRIGIGLLLLGVAFLFKYSIDQGWLTPSVRVGFGLALGIGLIVVGVFIHDKRKNFSQILSGGGIAAFYITGFAAFQLFNLVSYPIAFGFMILVTVCAFFLSLSWDATALSLIGVLGGLGTPFLLYTRSADLPGLIAYTCLVLCGTSAIYFYSGWRSILWTSAIGGWIVFLLAGIRGIQTAGPITLEDRWALQFGIIFGLIAFWALPVTREVFVLRNPGRWIHPSFKFLPRFAGKKVAELAGHHFHYLSIIVPIVTLLISKPLWKLSGTTWGMIVLGGAVLYGSVSWYLRRWDAGKPLSYTHMITALLLMTIAFCLLMKGDLLFFILTVEAAALHIIARRLSDRGLEISAHVLFITLACWLAYRLFIAHVFERAEGMPVFNVHALTSFFAILVAAGISMLLKPIEVRQAYQIISHLALLAWFAKELSSLPNGQAYVTIAWGLYAIALLIVGLRLNLDGIRITAIVTLFVVVGKLFLVDLTALKAIWRILLFLGFGAIFLFISYYFQALWRRSSKPQESSKG